MKIAIIGQSAFGKSVLEALVNKGEDKIVGSSPLQREKGDQQTPSPKPQPSRTSRLSSSSACATRKQSTISSLLNQNCA